MADIDDFDIDKSIAAAWAEFQARLSEVVSMIDESGDLTIGTGSGDDEETPFLRLSSPRPHLVRGEAASNAVLGEDYQLGPDQLATMERLGWQPPSVDGDHPTAHFWVECDQDDADRISELAVGALRDVYGVQHPVFLAPDQLAEVLQPGPAPVETSTGTLVPTVPRPLRDHAAQPAAPQPAGGRRAGPDVRLPADARHRRRRRDPGGVDHALPAYRRRTRRRWWSSPPWCTTWPAGPGPPRC